MELERCLALADVISEHPYLGAGVSYDDTDYNDSYDNWLKLRDEWNAFTSQIRDDTDLWQYKDVDVHMGFASGEGGFLIKRGDTIVSKFVTYVVG